MTLGRLLVATLVVGASLLCVRLGIWQLARWGEKRALNAELRAALAAPPMDAGGRIPRPEEAGGRAVLLRGRFDPAAQVLLRGRPRLGEAGVVVVTPFVTDSDTAAVLVERGWLAAEDAATLRPEAIPEDTARAVIGLLRPFPSGPPIPPMREIGTPERRLWSAPRLDADSLRVRLAGPLAPFVLVALPGHGAPVVPARDAPRAVDESMHLGYALQWFAIAALVPFVTWLAARGRRRRPGTP